MGLIRFLTISGHTFSYKAMLLSDLKVQIPRRSDPPDPELRIRHVIKNPLFSNLFSRPKEPEKPPPRPPQTDKHRPRNSLKTISVESRNLQYFPCDNRDF